MTQHNLQSHISWLLQSTIAPPAGVYVPESIDSLVGGEAATRVASTVNAQNTQSRPSGILRSHQAEAVVVRDVRPPVPAFTPISQPFSQSQRPPVRDWEAEDMARLQSAHKSRKPGLITQQQLATPEPSSRLKSSTATPSRLSAGYSSQLQGGQSLTRSLSMTMLMK